MEKLLHTFQVSRTSTIEGLSAIDFCFLPFKLCGPCLFLAVAPTIHVSNRCRARDRGAQEGKTKIKELREDRHGCRASSSGHTLQRRTSLGWLSGEEKGASPLLGIYPREIKKLKSTCTQLFVGALFKIAPNWKPKGSSAGKWVRHEGTYTEREQ